MSPIPANVTPICATYLESFSMSYIVDEISIEELIAFVADMTDLHDREKKSANEAHFALSRAFRLLIEDEINLES